MSKNQAPPKTIRFREDQLEKLKKLGKDQERSVHWLVIKAVDRYLEEQTI